MTQGETLAEATRSAITAMRWLRDSDRALGRLALALAGAIDDSPESIGDLAPKLNAILRDLGGTPATRRELDVGVPEEDIVTELRRVA